MLTAICMLATSCDLPGKSDPWVTIFTDDFNRADGPPGAAYTIVSGTWNIVSNQLVQQHTFDGGTPAGAEARPCFLSSFLSRPIA